MNAQQHLRFDRHGWLVAQPSHAIRHVPSPNFGKRPQGIRPNLLVIHHISLPPNDFGGPYIEQFFSNQLNTAAHPFFEEIKDLRVSAHFLIRRDGEIIQFVSTDDMAYHAGQSDFMGRGPCNPYSIGIELEGTGHTPYETAQYKQLAALTRALRRRYSLTAVRGHEHIAPGRKQDPGPSFDWARYAKDTPWLSRQLP